MRKRILGLAVLLVGTVATVSHADCGKCDKGGENAEATAASAKQCGEDCCPIAAEMEKLPKITFAVGGKTLCCEKTAAAHAEKTGGHLHFVVGDKEFHAKAEAQAALVEATEEFVSTFAEPHTCEASGKVTLAGAEQDCIFCAKGLAKKMNEAMESVQMKYVVGEQECNCPVTAAKLAKDAGVDKHFVVGEEKTTSKEIARLNLARAKYKAAVTVLVEASAKEDAVTEEQGT